MPCLIGLIALFVPRLVIVLLFLLSNYLGRAYLTILWPLLGFFFMPLTTLAYAWGKNSYGSLQGWPVAVLVIAVLLDLGIVGSGKSFRRRRRF